MSTKSPRPQPQKLTGKRQEIDQFLSKFDTFLFDCDGVLWQGSKLLPNIRETLEYLRSLGKNLIFVTNNSTKSRRSYSKKFLDFGIKVTQEEVFCSAYSTAIYLSRVLKIPSNKKVYIIGESGIEEELNSEKISHFGGPSNPVIIPEGKELGDIIGPDNDVAAVICGLDREINYNKYAIAFGYLSNPDTKFFATNIDSTFPTHGKLLPGAGSISAPLSYMTGRTPTSFGKPSQAMMDSIDGKYKLDKLRSCMVGDRLNTDIMFGIEGGLGGTLAVLTGVAKEVDIVKAGEEGIGPDVYLDQLSDLLVGL